MTAPVAETFAYRQAVLHPEIARLVAVLEVATTAEPHLATVLGAVRRIKPFKSLTLRWQLANGLLVGWLANDPPRGFKAWAKQTGWCSLSLELAWVGPHKFRVDVSLGRALAQLDPQPKPLKQPRKSRGAKRAANPTSSPAGHP